MPLVWLLQATFASQKSKANQRPGRSNSFLPKPSFLVVKNSQPSAPAFTSFGWMKLAKITCTTTDNWKRLLRLSPSAPPTDRGKRPLVRSPSSRPLASVMGDRRSHGSRACTGWPGSPAPGSVVRWPPKLHPRFLSPTSRPALVRVASWVAGAAPGRL